MGRRAFLHLVWAGRKGKGCDGMYYVGDDQSGVETRGFTVACCCHGIRIQELGGVRFEN